MKKIIALLLATLMLFGSAFAFTGCGKSDWNAIKERGYFTCGVTVFDPMNYKDADDKWVGFDTELAQAVAAELGVEVKFQLIQWGQKYLELEGGSIDCIWNGFTRGNESDGTPRSNYVDFSYSYMNNRQVIVTKTSKLSTMDSVAAFAGKKGAAEGGSAGEAIAKELAGEANYTPVESQAKALMELDAETVDFVVIDLLLASSQVGKGNYDDLSVNNAKTYDNEEYAIGFRKDSDFTGKVDAVLKKFSENGKLDELAEKYGLSMALIKNIGK